MYHLMVLFMDSLRDYFFENYGDVLMVKCLALMKVSNWDVLMVI